MVTVITQSMLFPWVGMLEQIRLADTLVHYDDVQFSKGSFTNRVQIKTAAGPRWMTVPLEGLKLGQTIDNVAFKPTATWKSKHLELLRQSFRGAPYEDDAVAIVEAVYSREYTGLGALARRSMLELAEYFGLLKGIRLIDSADLEIPGSGSQRVLDIVKETGGDSYVTGHGAQKYLDHMLFDSAGVRVNYMDYGCVPYPQLHGVFTPYVSGLDLIANCGRQGIEFICSDAKYWKEYINEPG